MAAEDVMESGRVVVGRIARIFGLRGEVLVLPTGEDPARFAAGSVLYLDESGPETLTVARVREREGGLLLRFEGRLDRTAVEDLARRTLYQDASALPPLPEGVYYHFQLVGLRVTRPDGSELGRLRDVLEGPEHDLYEVQGSAGEWLIPGRREFVAWVDLENGELRLTDRADLLEAQEKGGPEP